MARCFAMTGVSSLVPSLCIFFLRGEIAGGALGTIAAQRPSEKAFRFCSGSFHIDPNSAVGAMIVLEVVVCGWHVAVSTWRYSCV